MIVLLILLIVALSIKVFLILGYLFNFKKMPLIIADEQLPSVSILVAARNEESFLENCLESLLKMDYPKDKIEILLGNDQSTDGTGAICEQYVKAHSFIKPVPIDDNYKGLIAKANVIEQLADASHAEVLAIIDADMEVSAQWLRSMVSPTAHGFDMVSGFSVVQSSGFISSIQRVDWMNGIMVLKALADLGSPVTVLGNNMLVSAEAYKNSGGFAAIGPSPTEDNDLTIQVVKHGYKVYQNVNTMGASTQPMKTIDELFSQRRRWILGGLRHSWLKVSAMFISRSFLLWAMILMSMDLSLGLPLLLAYVLMELLQLVLIYHKSSAKISLFYGLITPFFNSLFDTFALLKIILSRQVVWKGRKM